MSLLRATNRDVIFKLFILLIAESAVAELEIQAGLGLQTFKIFFLYKLFECLRKSPSVRILILPLFSLQHTIPNFFFRHFFYSSLHSLA